MVRDVQFGGHIDECGIGRAVFDEDNTSLVSDLLDSVIYLILNGFDERLAFLVELALLTEVFAFEFEHFLLFLDDLLLALRTHVFRKEDLFRLIVGRHDACFLLRSVDLFLPAFGEHSELLVSLLVLRQVLEDVLHIDICYRLLFCCKSRATKQQGCNE